MEEEIQSKTRAFFCRICFDDGHLISPCDCAGSVGLVHQTCLEKWLSTTGKSTCEICRQDYPVYRKNKSFSEVQNTYILTYILVKTKIFIIHNQVKLLTFSG